MSKQPPMRLMCQRFVAPTSKASARFRRESEDDDTQTKNAKEVLEYLAKLKAYCEQNGLSEEFLKCLSVVEDEAVQNAVKRQRQAKITSFFC